MKPIPPRISRLAAVVVLFFVRQASAQFTDASAGLIEPASPCNAWADYDGDGDLDLLVAGSVAGTPTTILYQNTAGAFADSGIPFTGLEFASAAWGDYDNDGDLDLAMIGRDSGAISRTRVYRNDGGGSFVDIAGSFTDVVEGDLAWGDYDNDGDLDLVVTGITAASVGTPETRLYRNDGGAFTSVSHPFPAVHLSAVAWGDYDNDGDLDLFISGATASSIGGGLFRNDDGVFTDAGAGLTATQLGFAEWGDYDNDGDLDLLLGGISTTSVFGVTKLYKNTAGMLAEIATDLPNLMQSSAAWGDYDNDGDLDIIINGYRAVAPISPVSRLFRNDGGTFVDSAEVFPAAFSGAVAWGDSNNDGDLDLVLGGHLSTPTDILKLYNNGTATANTAPAAPANLVSMVLEGGVTLSWDAASDGAQTLPAGLTYAIRVGTTMGGNEILSPGSAASGYRRLPSAGSTQGGLMISLGDLAPGTYYWSVQSIDSGYLGSAFATEQSFTVLPAIPEVVSVALEPGDVIHVIWRGSPGSTYHIRESTTLAPASWMLKSTPIADMTTGLFEMSEVISIPRRFYRAARP